MNTAEKSITCMNCKRYYGGGINQCNVPTSGLRYDPDRIWQEIHQLQDGEDSEKEFALLQLVKEVEKAIEMDRIIGHNQRFREMDSSGQDFLLSHLNYFVFVSGTNKNMFYAKSTLLNKNNDCYFYKPKWKQHFLNVVSRFFR